MVKTVWDSSPILLDWEAGLDRQVEFLQFCLELGNRSLLDLLFVQYAADNIDYIANIQASCEANGTEENPEELLQQLKGISVEFLNGLKNTFECQIGEFARVQRDNKDKLQNAVGEKLEYLKGNFCNSMNASNHEGKELIMKFPPKSRSFAARLFSAMLTAGVTVFREQKSTIKKIVESIDNTGHRGLSEVVNVSIREAKAVNLAAADVAIKWIDTLVGDSHNSSAANEVIASAEDPQVDRLFFTKTESGWEVRSI